MNDEARVRAENTRLRDQISDLENDLSRIVSARDLTVRDLRAALVVAEKHAAEAQDRARQQLVLDGCLTCRGGAEYKALFANLTAVQARSTEQIEEIRRERDVSAQLARRSASLNAELGRVLLERDEVVAQRDAFGQKAAQLQEQLRVAEAASLLPGWTCGACGAFTGTVKEAHTACRCCGTERPR